MKALFDLPLPTTASQDYDARLFAQLAALEAHPLLVEALDEQRRLEAITDALVTFWRIA